MSLALIFPNKKAILTDGFVFGSLEKFLFGQNVIICFVNQEVITLASRQSLDIRKPFTSPKISISTKSLGIVAHQEFPLKIM
jgi:hypothetical protein